MEMTANVASNLLFALSTAFQTLACAQNAVNPEYLRDDIDGVGRVGKLIPLERQTLANIGGIVGATSDRADDTGFGGTLFEVAKGHGYVTVRVRGLSFNGRLAWARVSVESYSTQWSVIRERVMSAWDAGGGPPYTCDENECAHEWRQDEVIGAYKKSVALQLGPQIDLGIPEALREPYRYLMSPFEATLVGYGACGLPEPDQPIKPLPGREAIDALTAAHRTDLIVNVLRGYNPGARVYALLALQRLRRAGFTFPAGTAATMQKVLHLDVPVSMCTGCLVSSGIRATDVVKRWHDLER